MTRSILAAILMIAFVTELHAAGTADLQAGNEAAEKGNSDEAIQLFTRALAAGDLSVDEQLSAHKGRAREYSAKGLVADSFGRHDDGQRLRGNAIGEFTAALVLKADDRSVLVERGQEYHLNREFDLAIADFSAALKMSNSPSTLLQRAASRRANGAYDDAIADCTAALNSDVRDAGLDLWDIYNERAYAEFLAARYGAAGDDFDKALALGASARADDVLWLPYQLSWSHIAHARAGQNDAERLTSFSSKLSDKQWPGSMISYFLGQMRFEDVSAQPGHGGMGRSRECNLSLFTGEDALGKGNGEQAQKLIQRAREVCNIHSFQYLLAGTELGRLKQ